MNIHQIVTARRNATLKRWVRNPLIMVQANSPSSLGRLAYLDEDGDGSVGALGRRSTGNVVKVESGGGSPHLASVWVRSSKSGYGSYRAAYKSFGEANYGVKIDKANMAAYDVDHLLNRARAPSGSVFVRVEAVPSLVNQRWGSVIEKAASNPKFYANQKRGDRTMSWFIAAKLAGLMPPRGAGDDERIKKISSTFIRFGLNKSETETGIQSMMNFIAG